MGKVLECILISVLHGGLEIISPASVDTDSGRVFDIQSEAFTAGLRAECQSPEREYIIVNGKECDVARTDSGEYHILHTFGVFFTIHGYTQIKARNADDAMRIADQLPMNGISWDEHWQPTNAQLEDEP